MSWGFVVAGAATVIGAGIQSRSVDKQLKSADRAANQANSFQERLLQTSIDLSRPQLEVGNSALSALAGIFGLPQPSQLNFDQVGSGHPLYGDGNTPLDSEGLKQAYRDVLGREADPTGLNFYLTRGPRGEGEKGFISSKGKLPGMDPFGLTGSPGKRRSFTFNEFLKATQGSTEFKQKQAAGTLPEQRDFLSAVEEPQEQPAGGSANLNELVANNPLIKFNREQGEQAIARGAAARGLNQSGGTLQDLSRFNQDLSATGVQQFVLNPLFQLAGFGPQASAQVNNTATGVADNLSNIAIGRGAARSSAFQNQANNQQNTVNDLFGLFSQFQGGGK